MPHIPVANIYYLLCYAWNEFAPNGLAPVDSEQFPDTLHLFAHLLAAGTRNLHRSGLETGYKVVEEPTTTIRGRVLLASSLPLLASGPHRVVCAFDDLTADILTNQIIRSTIRNLLGESTLAKETRAELRAADHLLASVSTIPLSRRCFHEVRLHRNNRLYAFLLNLCRFFYESLEPVEGGRETKFQEPASEPERMRRIFEKFVRNFYARRQSEFRVSKDRFDWAGEALGNSDFGLIPTMETDVTLRSQKRTVVFECKYVETLYQSRFLAEKLRPAHLYQLSAYLRNLSFADASPTVEGILLYPAVDCQIRQTYLLHGHKVAVATVNLAANWNHIERELLGFVA